MLLVPGSLFLWQAYTTCPNGPFHAVNGSVSISQKLDYSITYLLLDRHPESGCAGLTYDQISDHKRQDKALWGIFPILGKAISGW